MQRKSKVTEETERVRQGIEDFDIFKDWTFGERTKIYRCAVTVPPYCQVGPRQGGPEPP